VRGPSVTRPAPDLSGRVAVVNMPNVKGLRSTETERVPVHGARRRVWIDLENSPHVPLFIPIIQELEKCGYSVLVTARDCFQVRDLARFHNLPCKVVGRHYGKSKALKVAGMGIRAFQLIPSVWRDRPDLAISHGSRTQLVASWFLRIPSLVIFDYEFAQALRVIQATWVMCPEVLGQDALLFKGVVANQILTYPGIKEDVYVPRFTPDPSILAQLGLERSDIIVTLRPPATEAHYHNPESEHLLDSVLEMLAEVPDAKIVLTPRNARQEQAIRHSWPHLFANRKIIVPAEVVDGLNLIWHSDLVISGGGTMNREAAALGVPVYSIFRGHIGAVDRYLAATGRLVLLESLEDVRRNILVRHRERGRIPDRNADGALRTIVDNIVKILDGKCSVR
jgi:predicted glycosyltransferase